MKYIILILSLGMCFVSCEKEEKNVEEEEIIKNHRPCQPVEIMNPWEIAGFYIMRQWPAGNKTTYTNKPIFDNSNNIYRFEIYQDSTYLIQIEGGFTLGSNKIDSLFFEETGYISLIQNESKNYEDEFDIRYHMETSKGVSYRDTFNGYCNFNSFGLNRPSTHDTLSYLIVVKLE